jgi:hypothetical protein
VQFLGLLGRRICSSNTKTLVADVGDPRDLLAVPRLGQSDLFRALCLGRAGAGGGTSLPLRQQGSLPASPAERKKEDHFSERIHSTLNVECGMM